MFVVFLVLFWENILSEPLRCFAWNNIWLYCNFLQSVFILCSFLNCNCALYVVIAMKQIQFSCQNVPRHQMFMATYCINAGFMSYGIFVACEFGCFVITKCTGDILEQNEMDPLEIFFLVFVLVSANVQQKWKADEKCECILSWLEFKCWHWEWWEMF